jgi:hypothetical protein
MAAPPRSDADAEGDGIMEASEGAAGFAVPMPMSAHVLEAISTCRLQLMVDAGRIAQLQLVHLASKGTSTSRKKGLRFDLFSHQIIWSATNMSISPDLNKNVGQETLVPVQMEALVPV